MRRALEVAVTLSIVWMTGCGDASAPDPREPSVTDPTMGTPQTSAPAPSSTGTPAPSNPAPTPAPQPMGSVSFRVANFLPGAGDACVSPDAGKTWIGPLMHQLAGKPLDASTMSAYTTVPNAHFTARAVSGTDCGAGVGADVPVKDMLGSWPATIVLGQKAGAPEMHVLIDEPSVSSTSTFIRFVHAADWAMDADLGEQDTDCCGNTTYDGIFDDTPFLSTAKAGLQLTPQGFAVMDPLDGGTLILQTTTSQDVRATITVSTAVGDKFSVFTMGDDKSSNLLFCDDVAPPNDDHTAQCTVVNDGDTFQSITSQNQNNNGM